MGAADTIVWDLETVPDLDAAARMLGMDSAAASEVRQALGDGFPETVQIGRQYFARF